MLVARLFFSREIPYSVVRGESSAQALNDATLPADAQEKSVLIRRDFLLSVEAKQKLVTSWQKLVTKLSCARSRPNFGFDLEMLSNVMGVVVPSLCC